MNKQIGNGSKRGLIRNLFFSSVILSAIDKFTAYIYSLFSKGFFGYIFTGYKHDASSVLKNRISQSKFSGHTAELRYGISRIIERSIIYNLVLRLSVYLKNCRVKVYGVFFLSFGAYNIIVSLFSAIVRNSIDSILANRSIIFSLIIVFACIPLLFSRRTLTDALLNSYIGRLLLRIIGFFDIKVTTDSQYGYSSIAFILGVIVAVLTHSYSPVYVIFAIAAVIWAYLVLVRPEIGVLTLFFAMPFLPTMVLAGVVIYTFISWCIKLIRGKRVVKFETVDISVMAFMAILFSGGIISLSPLSLKPALLMVCLLIGYFLTVQLIRSREWLIRCSVSAVISATLVSLYGIFTYYSGAGYYSRAWLDNTMFNGISNRAVSTLENPNMLGEYLILLIPIAVVMIIGKNEGLRKIPALFCTGIMCACLLLTWSRGAWLALIVSLVCLVFMWHYRSIWLVIAGAVSIPFLPYILPASIISRFSSIGNMSDSSTSYRVYIWRASVNMIKDNWLAGIGIGENAWSRMYPLYSFMGIEAAPHSHNLFIQIWLELGIFGILAFLVFIFILLKSAFSLFSRLSSTSSLVTPELSEKMLYNNIDSGRGKSESLALSKRQIRLSVIGPLTGIISVLVQGMTDYSWYNYRLYLMFWLVAGLVVAYIRNGNTFIRTYISSYDASNSVKTTNKRKDYRK